jgi:hypothetical protein
MVFVHVQNNKAAPVNQIKAETDEDRLRVAEGEAANERRKSERKMSLKAAPPTVEETVIVFVCCLRIAPHSVCVSSRYARE